MEQLLVLLRGACTATSGIGGLALGVTFTGAARERFRVLAALDARRLLLFLVTAVSLLLGSLLDTASTILSVKDKSAKLEVLRSSLSLEKAAGTSLKSVRDSMDELNQETLNAVATAIIIGTERFTAHSFADALTAYRAADEFVEAGTLKAKIADCYYYLGDYERVILYERDAMRLSPEWSGPPFLLAQAFLRLGRKAEAEAEAARSCELGFAEACDLLQGIREGRTGPGAQ